jgi:hypothetical protein
MKTARSLAALYAATDTATREHGRDWYRLSERDIRRLARELPNGCGQSAAAAIFAALSPRQAYRQNWEAAWAIARYRQAGAIRAAAHRPRRRPRQGVAHRPRRRPG